MAAGEELEDYESWEDMEDNGVLDRKLEKMRAAMSQKELRTASGSKPDTVVFLAEDGRTRYVPPEPTVKILKRPVVNNSHAAGDGFIMNGDMAAVKPRQPIKTLQQREMEYAEARLRILGEAQSPEEKQSPTLIERIRRIQNKMSCSSPGGASSAAPGSAVPPSVVESPSLQQHPLPPSFVCMTSPPLPPSPLAGSAAFSSLATMVTMATASTTIAATGHMNSCYDQPSAVTVHGYSLLNHHHHPQLHQQQQQHHIHHFHHLHQMNHHHPPPLHPGHHLNLSGGVGNGNNISGGVSNNSSSSRNSAPGSHNNNYSGIAVVAPIVLRQPRGPDGTRGFNIR